MARDKDIDRLREEVEELFSDLWQISPFARRHGFRPQLDCFRTEDPPELTVLVELPGVEPGNVEVVVSEGTLFITGERRRPSCGGRVYQQMEIEYGPFQRRLPLPPDTDVSSATASYRRGLLTIVFPIAAAEPARPGKVPIQIRSRS